MKCNNCQAEINPAWVHCISVNACPGCGGALMDEASKVLLDELKEAMEKMSGSPEALAGWLMDTYHLKKKGEVAPVVFHEKNGKTEPKIENSEHIKIADTSVFDKFRKLSGADKIVNNNKYSNMINMINGINDEMYGGGPPKPEPQEEVYAGLSPEEAKEQLSIAAKAKGRALTVMEAKQVLDGGNELYLDKEGNPINGGNSNNVVSLENVSELTETLAAMGGDLHPILEADRQKRLQMQYNLQNGSIDSKNKFRRV